MGRGVRAFIAVLATTLGCGALAGPSGAASPADWLYEPTTFNEIRLQIPEPGYKKLEAEPKVAYVPATFSIAETNGTPGSAGPFSEPRPVEVKLKGSLGSLRSINQKAAFKLKFGKKTPFLGLEKMTLNNMVQDPSMTHEAVIYDAFHAMGVPAPHVGFTYLTVNGKSYGLHLNIETQDKVSMEKLYGTPFAKPPQHVYEGEYGADVSSAILPGGSKERWTYFQVDEGEEKELTDLETLVAATEAGGAPFGQRVEALADLPEMTRMWAVEKFAGNWDGYAGQSPDSLHPNNYYLYSDASGRFSMMPSGTDQTWAQKLDFSAPGGHLFELCLADATSCRPLYRQAGEQLLSTLTAASLDKDSRCVAAAVNPWRKYEEAASEAQKQPNYSESTPAAQAAMRKFISERPAELASYLGVPAPPKTSDESSCPPLRPIGGFKPPPAPGAKQPTTAAPAPPSDPPAAPLRLGRHKVLNGAIVVSLETTAPGRVSLEGSFGAGDNRAVACRGGATANAAGPLRVRCRLTTALRRRLHGRAAWVHLAATIATAGSVSQPHPTSLRLGKR